MPQSALTPDLERWRSRWRCAWAATLFLLLPAAIANGDDLTVGSQAPGFSLAGSDGRTHTLAEHAGKRGVVLAWFPKAFTPG